MEIVGIGNPLLDILYEVNEETIKTLGLRKGTFNLITREQLHAIEEKMRGESHIPVPGGSAANAIAIAGMLGAKTGFIGKIGDDETGNTYEKVMQKEGAKTHCPRDKETPTGRAITFITPDKERTFATYLGAALTLQKEDIIEAFFKGIKILHLTGYILDDEVMRAAAMSAIHAAKKHKARVSLDLADPGVVERNKAFFESFLCDYVDIVFANENEAKAMTGKEPEEAAQLLGETVPITIVKIGEEGAIVCEEGQVEFISSYSATVIDTTGAGDAFAGGFLFALNEGHDLTTAGKLGCFLGAQVVSQIGARLQKIPDVSEILE